MSAKIETTTTSSRFNLNLLLSRIRGISLLNAEEVITLKQEQHATPQAVGVLVISALAYGLGYTLLGEIQSNTRCREAQTSMFDTCANHNSNHKKKSL